ncbi:hypothetical protein ACM66B_002820 [Microbotryomycetes sp. NB124-2]
MSDAVSDKGSTSLHHIEGAKTPEVAVHHVEGNVQLLDADGKVRLVPTPTTSPRDPLNFSKLVKAGIFFNVLWFSIMSLSVVGGFGSLAPIFFQLYIPQGVPADHVARLITWPSLFTGLGNWAFLPLGLVFGRRPMFLLASLMLVASTAWAAKSGTSFDSHFAARLVQGFAAGVTESLLPLIVTDMTFVHQRSRAFGIYWSLQSSLGAIFNLASAYEAVNLDWPAYYWIFCAFAAFGAVTVFFALPETKFERPAFAIDGQMTRVDEYGHLVVLSDEEAAAISAKSDQERLKTDNEAPPTYLETLKPLGKPQAGGLKIILQCYVDMARAMLHPAVWWSLGASACVLGFNIATSLSFASFLQTNFNWGQAEVGLIYLGSIPACLFAYVMAGWGGDKLSLFAVRRNGGKHLPENRLLALIFPTVTGLAVALGYGFIMQAGNKLHWFALVFTFNYLVAFFVAVLITTTTYVVECLPHRAGAALVMVVGGKNILSFGTSTAIVPLVNSGNYSRAYGILTGVEAGWFLLAIPLYFFGARIRAWLAAKGV